MQEFIREMCENNTPEFRVLTLMHRMSQFNRGEISRTGFDLSISQLELLQFVGSHSGCHIQDVAEGLNLTPPTISVSIRRLEEEGWVERRSDPNDGRATCLYLTDKSGQALQHTVNHQMKMAQSLLGELNQKEQNQLLALLEKAIIGMENHTNERDSLE